MVLTIAVVSDPSQLDGSCGSEGLQDFQGLLSMCDVHAPVILCNWKDRHVSISEQSPEQFDDVLHAKNMDDLQLHLNSIIKEKNDMILLIGIPEQHVVNCIQQFAASRGVEVINRQELMASSVDPLFKEILNAISKNQSTLPKKVGVIMKASRYRELAHRGILSLDPYDGLLIFPLNKDCWVNGMQDLDAFLHKGTDDLVRLELDKEFLEVDWSNDIKKIRQKLAELPNVCVIDEFEYCGKVIDRVRVACLMSPMTEESVYKGYKFTCGPPKFFKIDSFSNPNDIMEMMHAKGLNFPVIVKPCVACGVSGSHHLAIVKNKGGFFGLNVGLPASIQQYINHGGVQFKFYVTGCRVFCSIRASTQDVDESDDPSLDGAQVQYFDTLKDLGKSKVQPSIQTTTNTSFFVGSTDNFHSDSNKEREKCPIVDFHAGLFIASYIKQQLGLTLFGFDVLVDSYNGNHYVVDVNYFPSCRDIENAPEAIRHAIKDKILMHEKRSIDCLE